MTRLSGIGEFPLIDRLSGVLGVPKGGALLLGIGDDAAAWHPTPGTATVATADALVEGVHFDLATTSWTDLGWKALAENISDVAAMGCEPRYALVTLGLPGTTDPADVEALYSGMRECGEAYGCSVVGGDVVAAPQVVISVALIGESMRGEGDVDPPLLTRSAARPGDLLAVTGALGASAAGLRALAEIAKNEQAPAGGTLNRAVIAELVKAHRRPTPRVEAGRTLVENGLRCAIDISDGLVADVGHICERSGVDAEIEAARVPTHSAVSELFPADVLELALAGGEDYELACAGRRETIERAAELLRRAGGPELTIIGKIIEGQGATPAVRVRDASGAVLPLAATGYRHF